MKKRKNFFKILLCLTISLSIISAFSVFSSASEVEPDAEEGYVTEENVFDEIYRAVTENAADILSLLSFAASVTVALFYKYALSPLIKGGLEKISGGVKDISGESKQEYERLCEYTKDLSKDGEELKEGVNSLIESVREIAKKDNADLEKSLLCVMTAQVNMLYEIFQSSALPVYQKEAVGNMINEMRSELSKNEIAGQ